jgi:hypothetical protein
VFSGNIEGLSSQIPYFKDSESPLELPILVSGTLLNPFDDNPSGKVTCGALVTDRKYGVKRSHRESPGSIFQFSPHFRSFIASESFSIWEIVVTEEGKEDEWKWVEEKKQESLLTNEGEMVFEIEVRREMEGKSVVKFSLRQVEGNDIGELSCIESKEEKSVKFQVEMVELVML